MLENLGKDIKKVLVSEDEIKEICERVGKQITEDYQGKDVLMIGLMKGALPFIMELIKHIDLKDFEMDFIKVSSYSGTESTNVIFKKDVDCSVKGKHIIFVDDIIDTGKTLNAVSKMYEARGAASIAIAVLLDKPEGAEGKPRVTPKYIGTTVPKEFVVGFGLDYNEKYRQLPYIGVLKEEIYTKEE